MTESKILHHVAVAHSLARIIKASSPDLARATVNAVLDNQDIIIDSLEADGADAEDISLLRRCVAWQLGDGNGGVPKRLFTRSTVVRLVPSGPYIEHRENAGSTFV